MKSSGQRTRSQAPCRHEPSLKCMTALWTTRDSAQALKQQGFFIFGKIVDSDFKIQTVLHCLLVHNGILLLAPLFSRLWLIIVADTSSHLYQECSQQD